MEMDIAGGIPKRKYYDNNHATLKEQNERISEQSLSITLAEKGQRTLKDKYTEAAERPLLVCICKQYITIYVALDYFSDTPECPECRSEPKFVKPRQG